MIVRTSVRAFLQLIRSRLAHPGLRWLACIRVTCSENYSMADSNFEHRFIQIETKIAYQEKLVSELNEVVHEQSRTIDRLEARVLYLERMLREQMGEAIGHEPPPHY